MNTVGIDSVLADFAINTKAADLPADALGVARLSFLDWLAVGIAGKNEPVSQIVREMITEEGGAAQAGVFGSDQLFPARASALANGAISHALDYDDTHFIHIGHPSVAVFSAAFALAQKLQCSRDELLVAALLGLEATCRVGDWLGRSHYHHGFHQTGTSGSIGATVACARLLALDLLQTRHAIGLAATRASGLKCQFGTMGKPFHAGMAASNGVEAAQLAAKGFVSRPDALQCEQGLGETHHGEAKSEAFDGLGEQYVFESVQHKLHACCHGLHATLEALIELRESHGLTALSVTSVDVYIHPRWLSVCNIASPASGLEAKFSYRMTAAMVLHKIATDMIESYDDRLCANPELLATCEKVTVHSDELLSETGARVVVRTMSGDAIENFHDLENTMEFPLRVTKVMAKCSALLGQDRARYLWDSITNDGNDLDRISEHFF